MQCKRIGVSALAAAVLAGLSCPASAVRVSYVLDAGVEHNDNVGLSTTDPVSQTFPRAGVGLTITENTSTIQAEVSGRAEYFGYREPFDDSVEGTLSGRFNWVAIPERLHFTAEDNLTLQPINALVPNAPANRQQLNVLSLGPSLFFHWAETLHGAVDLRYIDSNAEVTEELDSQRWSLGLRTIKDLSTTTRVSFNLQGQTVDFDDPTSRDYERADAFARYERNLANFDLGLDLGWSRLEYDDGDRRDDPLLRTDIAWRPSARSTYTLTAWSQFSDLAADTLISLDPDAAVPGSLPVGDAVVTSSQYRERRITLDYQFTGERTTFSIAPYTYEARYVDANTFDQDGHGLRVDFNRRLRDTLYLDAYAAFDRIDYLVLDREDDSRYYGLGLRYQWSRRLSTRLDWMRYQRRSSLPGLDADQDAVYLSVTYANR